MTSFPQNKHDSLDVSDAFNQRVSSQMKWSIKNKYEYLKLFKRSLNKFVYFPSKTEISLQNIFFLIILHFKNTSIKSASSFITFAMTTSLYFFSKDFQEIYLFRSFSAFVYDKLWRKSRWTKQA